MKELLGADFGWVADYPFRWALFEDHAIVHEDCMIGGIAIETRLVSDDNHGHALLGQGLMNAGRFSGPQPQPIFCNAIRSFALRCGDASPGHWMGQGFCADFETWFCHAAG